jgi:hypothetical protein
MPEESILPLADARSHLMAYATYEYRVGAVFAEQTCCQKNLQKVYTAREMDAKCRY